ncbi:16S rRNA (guanine(527)-N(7))-methyltransferase RsmG [Cellulomonas sp. 179-A 4D5 NHS]|uniref:16S rRNA (guanine(527)-N(7))-methyltransferase RsmG n=1 Tax=Cellulomonas sp. 179-A 4D5 NHS TaxID=3142378 RepID=UPI00399FBC9E
MNGAETDDAIMLPDPLEGDPRLPTYFGDSWAAVESFRRMLVDEGVLRGLVGPREVGRLWERHLLNSAAVVPFLPQTGVIVDLGSGAGLPGVVVAAMRPEAQVVLLEPMERRCSWLLEVVNELGLTNATVTRARAEDVHGSLTADAVTARAVAPLDRLYRWALPLLTSGGVLVALKGGRAADEVQAAGKVGKRLGAGQASIHAAHTIDGVDETTVVRVVREAVRGVR